MVVETLAALDTFIYAAAVFVIWNFYWTRKQKQKLFGDPKDETAPGLLRRVQDLEEEDNCNCEE